MVLRYSAIAIAAVLAASPAPASIQDSDRGAGAPPGTPDTLYCMRIEAIDSRIEEVKCWTRAEWAEREVDVDQDWAKEGVAIIVDGVRQPVRG